MKLDHTTGTWLAAAAILLIAALALHPPPATGTQAFMEQIAAEGTTWVVAHWLAAAALAAFTVTGMLASGRASGTARGAWGLLAVGSLATLITAVTEATVVAHVAAEGDLAAFQVWERFVGGMSMGFVLLALAVSAIATHQFRLAEPALPRWSTGTASGLGIVAAGAWILGMGFDVAPAAPIWLVSSLMLNVWLIWFGIALVRDDAAAPRRGVVHA